MASYIAWMYICICKKPNVTYFLMDVKCRYKLNDHCNTLLKWLRGINLWLSWYILLARNIKYFKFVLKFIYLFYFISYDSLNPIALGEQWLAFADRRLLSIHQSCGGMVLDSSQSYKSTMIYAAKSITKVIDFPIIEFKLYSWLYLNSNTSRHRKVVIFILFVLVMILISLSGSERTWRNCCF